MDKTRNIENWKPDWVALRILDFGRKVHNFGDDDKALAAWVRKMSEDLIYNNASDEFTQSLIYDATEKYCKRAKAGKAGGIAKARKQKQKSQEVAGNGNVPDASSNDLEEYHDQETASGNANDQSDRHKRGREEPATDADIRKDSENTPDAGNGGTLESGTSAAGDSFEARKMPSPGEGRKTFATGSSHPVANPPPPCVLNHIQKYGKQKQKANAQSPPRSSEDVRLFALDRNLDIDDARMWYQMNFVDRPGCDKDGVAINNWKGHCTAYCKAEAERRKAG